MFDECLRKLDSLDPLIEIVNDSEVTAMSQFLYDRVSNADSYLVFLGETSSGKSSLINGLVNQQVLPVAASPSTGSITEVELSTDVKGNEYFAINKDATIEQISEGTFRQLILKPDDKLSRTKITCRVEANPFGHLRIFDTPGYGSIVKEHEEVLKNFLPNSDVVVYAVSYKIGVQNKDYAFLGFLKQLIREDVEVILLVNRCPDNVGPDDVKIKEIQRYVNDITGLTPKLFMVKNFAPVDETGHAIPSAPELWGYVSTVLNGESRRVTLRNTFDQFIQELFDSCHSVIKKRCETAKLSAESYGELLKAQEETARQIERAIELYVKPTFADIQEKLPSRIQNAAKYASENIKKLIDESSSTSMQQMTNYTIAHLLPHCIEKEVISVQEYIDMRLSELNDQVDDYIQKEVKKFSTKVSLPFSYLDQEGRCFLEKAAKELVSSGLKSYFGSMGGAAGVNGGIANGASHALKKVGDLFGHTFKRGTHNALKHGISKIGGTSMKAVGNAITVVISLGCLGYDYWTWKRELKKKVDEATKEWADKSIPDISKDIDKLLSTNIDTLKEIANLQRHMFEPNQSDDLEQCEKDLRMSENIGKLNGLL